MKTKQIIALFLSVAFISSCTNDDDFATDVNYGNVHKGIKVNFAPVTCGDKVDTRSTLTFNKLNGDIAVSKWNDSIDALGLINLTKRFSYKVESEMETATGFIIARDLCWSSEDSVNVILEDDAEGAFNTKDKYRLFYPYNSENITLYRNENDQSLTADEVDCEEKVYKAEFIQLDLEGQKQEKDTCYEHLKDYLFCFSDIFSVKNINDEIPVNMHVGNSILKMELELPKGKYKSITIENVNGYHSFATFRRFTIEYGLDDDVAPYPNPYSVNTDYSNDDWSTSMTLELNPNNFNIKKASEKKKFYMALATNNTGYFIIKAKTTNGKVYKTAPQRPIHMEKGKYYTVSAKCNLTKDTPDVVDFYGHVGDKMWVDLDLPKGVKWSAWNLGADKITEVGDFFAWGEITPWNKQLESDEELEEDYEKNNILPNSEYLVQNTRSDYTSSNYKWGGEDGYPYMKLLPEHDAARYWWGGKWRMPTYSELWSLFLQTIPVEVKNYQGSGIDGMALFKRKEGDALSAKKSGVRVNEKYDVNKDPHLFFPIKDTSSHTDGYGLSIGCSEKDSNDKTSVLNYKYGGACVYSKPIWASFQIRPVYDESLGN